MNFNKCYKIFNMDCGNKVKYVSFASLEDVKTSCKIILGTNDDMSSFLLKEDIDMFNNLCKKYICEFEKYKIKVVDNIINEINVL